MTCERSASPENNRRARRREILCADLARWSCERRLWDPRGAAAAPARVRLREAVRRAVETALTAKQREVVEAYFFEGLSQGEIACRLGVTQQVVQKRLYGAPRQGRRVGGALPRLRAALEGLVLEPRTAS